MPAPSGWRTQAVALPLLLLSAVSCGGPRKATIPVDSPLRPFTPPEEEAPAATSPQTPQGAQKPAPPAAPPAR